MAIRWLWIAENGYVSSVVDTPEDGALLNAEIIKHGYGFAYTRFPFARMEEFRRLEREAREQGRGLWALKVIDPDFLHPKKTLSTSHSKQR
jgi:endonuclease YncB( thermonuclease family)